MDKRRFEKVWNQLRGKKPHMKQFLDEVRLSGIRGFHEFGIRFNYPVSVIAGGNASGKTTVLFAAACAYNVPGSGYWDFRPSTLFPNYLPKQGERRDTLQVTLLDYDFSTPTGRLSMRWRRGKNWNQSFFGRKGANQPSRPVYLRTLSNLTNPTEVRSVLQVSRSDSARDESPLTPYQITFAQNLLPFDYSEVMEITIGRKNLLFAKQESGASYSEFHMAAGERAILRLSQEIAQLSGALILIDEVEAGLHPWVQQLLMIHLQELALRNDLQVIVTTHSPVILDSVPIEGRVFLDRDADGSVKLLQPLRDVVQNSLYGRTHDRLNILCEDDAAEAILRGTIDHLASSVGFKHDSIQIGRDTGADEFPSHVNALSKFGSLDNFVFVLDGDQRQSSVEDRMRSNAVGSDLTILYLPSDTAPEAWIWDRLRKESNQYEVELGFAPGDLADRIAQLDSMYSIASGTDSDIAKEKLQQLADTQNRTVADICRIAARTEATDPRSELQILADDLSKALIDWQSD